MTDLKPCPFCGGVATLEGEGKVFCLNAGCPVVSYENKFSCDTPGLTHEQWNTRQIEDALQAEIARLADRNIFLEAFANDTLELMRLREEGAPVRKKLQEEWTQILREHGELQTENARLRLLTDWQPMETAPLDKPLFVKNHSGQYDVGQFSGLISREPLWHLDGRSTHVPVSVLAGWRYINMEDIP